MPLCEIAFVLELPYIIKILLFNVLYKKKYHCVFFSIQRV